MVVRFTATGRARFLDAIASIRRTGPQAARQFRQRAEKALKRLARFPNSGALVTDLPESPYREVYVHPYRFFYQAVGNIVWIVAVWHGAQVPKEPEGPGGNGRK